MQRLACTVLGLVTSGCQKVLTSKALWFCDLPNYNFTFGRKENLFWWFCSVCLLLQPFGKFSCSNDSVIYQLLEELQELYSFAFGLDTHRLTLPRSLDVPEPIWNVRSVVRTGWVRSKRGGPAQNLKLVLWNIVMCFIVLYFSCGGSIQDACVLVQNEAFLGRCGSLKLE